MPLSATMSRWINRRSRRPVTLVTIDLTGRGGPVLYFGDRYWQAPDGNYYEGVIAKPGEFDAGGQYLETGWQPVDLTLTITKKRLSWQIAAKDTTSLLTSYRFIGAPVVIRQALMELTDLADSVVIFTGVVADNPQVTGTGFTLHCVQDRSWITAVPPRTADLQMFPKLPADFAGTPVPIVVGDVSTDAEFLSTGDNASDWGIAREPVPALVIDPSTTTPTYIVSDRQMHTAPLYLYLWENTIRRFARTKAALTIANPAGGPCTAALTNRQFEIPFFPVALSVSNTAYGASNLIREEYPRTYSPPARLDFNLNQKVLALVFPEVQGLGKFISARVRIVYDAVTLVPPKPKLGWKPATIALGNNTLTGLGSFSFPYGYPTESDSYNCPTAAAAGAIINWQDALYGIKDGTLWVELQNAGEQMDVYGAVLLVTYEPEARVVKPGTRVRVGNPPTPAPIDAGRIQFPLPRQPKYADVPELSSFDTGIYAFGKGLKDDVSGTYTGTPNALIEHPADVVHWLLRNLAKDGAGVPAAEIETTAGAFGSFVDVKYGTANYKVAGTIDKKQDIDDLIAELGASAMIRFYRRMTAAGAKWVAVSWDTGSAVNYRDIGDEYTFGRDRVVRDSFQASLTSQSFVSNIVRVKFGQDIRARTWRDEAFVTPTDSRGLLAGIMQRDQQTGTIGRDRESKANTSKGYYGVHELPTLNLRWVRDAFTATKIRNRIFDHRYEPRVIVTFQTFLNAVDLERGHVIQFSTDWDSRVVFPKPGSNGSWATRKFRVISVGRSLPKDVVRYSVRAVEV